MGAGGLGQLAFDPLVQAVDPGQRLVGFRAGAEEDRLLDLGGAGEALEGLVAGTGAQHRARVGERFEGADQQRPLAVEEADRALAVDHPGDRAARREVVVSSCILGRLARNATREAPEPSRPAPRRSLRLDQLVQLVGGEDLVEVLAESVSRSSAAAARSSRHSRLAASRARARRWASRASIIAATSTSRRVPSESA